MHLAMAILGTPLWRGLILVFFHFCYTAKGTEQPVFLVTYPAVIQPGTESKLCASLLQPKETVIMTVYLVNNDQNRTLIQERTQEEFHRCFNFQAPLVQAESKQSITVEVQGESFHLKKERKVLFKPFKKNMAFIQTDKPIYIPGHTVLFRIVSMDSNFIPIEQMYPVVYLEDSRQNRISQWVDVSSKSKILQLSHNLDSEAPLGMYQIIVEIDGRQIRHYFRVKEYALPKFEIKLNLPETIEIGGEGLKVEVCGRYTYGQPVPGKVFMELCGKSSSHSPSCLTESVEMSDSGCIIHVFNIFDLLKNQSVSSFHFSAKLTEEGTGISMSKHGNVYVSYTLGELTFVDTPDNYEHGAIIEGKIKATYVNGTPIANKNIFLSEGGSGPPTLMENLTTDADGIAHFSVNTTTFPAAPLNLLASDTTEHFHSGNNRPYIINAFRIIHLARPHRPHTPTRSELTIEDLEEPLKCDTDVPVTVRYAIVGEAIKNGSLSIIYLALSNGEIVQYGAMKVTVKDSDRVNQGKVSFTLHVSAETASRVQILVYCVPPSETVIAGHKDFRTEQCFRNKVSLQFSPSKAVPGEENTLQLSAEPGSLCGLSAVDQSVLILESGKRLSADKIFRMRPPPHHPVELDSDHDCVHVRDRRYVLPFPGAVDISALSLFKRMGLNLATNAIARIPPCVVYRGNTYHLSVYPEGSRGFGMAGGSGIRPTETIRSFFPETWIWNLLEVGESGSAQLPVTVPDTITTWETEAFCLSSKGFGLAAPAELTVFQPFFLELSLPYSIIRGELFELKATVFNYLSKSIMVKVTPAPSSDYTLKPSSDGQYSSCLRANGRKTFRWTLIPSVLGVLNVTVSAEAEASQSLCDNEIVTVPDRGRIDTVTRTLLVKAEGTEKTNSYSWLLCPHGNTVTEEVELTLPEVVVEGSVKASVSVLGDILGRALQNLDGLLKMPYGCGEQNIALLSPNIYILQYLESTEQLTSAIRERATGFLKNGYQRQLNYKHSDGSYSAFGVGDGNTWLTAFVMRSFGKAQTYIFIEPRHITSAKQWLVSQQTPDGCFMRKGRLFQNRMKGGVSDDVTMTAYIVAAMLELNISVMEPSVSKGLLCLKSSISNLTNNYATALLAYTFSLAGEKEIRSQLLQKLDDVASKEGGHLSWSQSNSEQSESLAVEMSSYVLLAVLTNSPLSTADLGYASRIVNWLVRQQNPYGGFSSTQDTVVALQALALYATKVFSSGSSATVTVQSASGASHLFDVDQSNTLLYQERALQDIPAKYSVEVKGSACVSVQMAAFYNIPTPKKDSVFSVEAKTEENCTKFPQTLVIKITVQYNGSQESTNMVIVDIKMLSGFIIDETSLKTVNSAVNNIYKFRMSPQLRRSVLVSRVDSQDDHVIMYLEELPKAIPLHYTLSVIQQVPGKNLKPAVIKVYDYYQTSDQAETEYSFQCTGKEPDISHNEVQ
ncbi:alpha-2-macroglobulin-like [Chanos chanos]|uniref:Alpha-2-macroglobulin-like n=1 Tax=Chanos chanos TaxID=29144 RepID=A0A6J2VJB1_CHACN|nr:alpha-2-macroglobulin-like [Chanos chanos]